MSWYDMKLCCCGLTTLKIGLISPRLYYIWLHDSQIITWWNLVRSPGSTHVKGCHSNDWSEWQKCHNYIDGLAQDCSNSIANALKLLQCCSKPSAWDWSWGGRATVLSLQWEFLNRSGHIFTSIRAPESLWDASQVWKSLEKPQT